MLKKLMLAPRVSLSFRDHHFARPEQLIGWIAGQAGRVSCDLITVLSWQHRCKAGHGQMHANQFCKTLSGFSNVRPYGAGLWVY